MTAPAGRHPHSSSPYAADHALRTAGKLSLGAGLVFLLTVTYLFTVLPATGWNIDMFDAPDQLLPWIYLNSGAYQLLWLLYFGSQALLLPVPRLLERLGGRAAGTAGTAAVVIAMVGLVILFACSPVLARGFHRAVESGLSGTQQTVLVLHDLFADTGKDLRLFSELLLAFWLVAVSLRLKRSTGGRRWWLLTAIGGWTFAVVGVKLFLPEMELEDWLGFVLGVGYLGLGVALLRLTARQQGGEEQRRSGGEQLSR